MAASSLRPGGVSEELDEQLDRQVLDAVNDAVRLLNPHASDSADFGPRLPDVIASIVERIAAVDSQRNMVRETQVLHEQQLGRLRRRSDDRFTAVEQVHESIGRLRKITSPSVMLASAPAELADRSELARVVLSVVRDGQMIAEAVHFSGDDDGGRAALEALQANPIRLEHPLIETDVLRRQRATVVADAQLHPRVDRGMARIMQWESYVAAPVAVRSDVIAVIHADRGAAQHVDVLHRDVLWEFATGLANAYESASLRRTLRQEREQMRALLDWLNARSAELNDTAIELVATQRTRLPPPLPADTPRLQTGRDDSTVFADVLTRRELEILRLLAEGKTNGAIAAELVVSPGTIKFHVSSILRKLHVANRAQAVSRYYALLGVGPRRL
jgi:LuxR family transcriptional regulator, regulator of acetate metabolism